MLAWLKYTKDFLFELPRLDGRGEHKDQQKCSRCSKGAILYTPPPVRLESDRTHWTPIGFRAVRAQSDQNPSSVRAQSDQSLIRIRAQSELSPMRVRAQSDQSPSSVRSESELSPSSVRSESELSPSSVRSESELSLSSVPVNASTK